MNPKVSICIPTYNRKDYLKETLDSVFAQTYKDYEVVVVDDGSTDGTAEMLKDIDRPIRYYRQENSGDAAARNKMINLAQGEFITFIDSDDLLIDDAVDRMMKVMEAEGGNAIVYGPYYRIDQNGRIYGRFKQKLYSGYVTKYLFQNIFVHSCGSMFPKRVLEDSGGFDTSLRRCSVYKLLLELSLKYRFIAIKEPVFKRRRHTSNICDSSFEDRKIEYDVLENFYRNGGGKELIPLSSAMKRLSKEAYRAGRAAIREKKYHQAAIQLSDSMRKHPNIKSLIHRIRVEFIIKLFS